jgi:hypothetical protein
MFESYSTGELKNSIIRATQGYSVHKNEQRNFRNISIRADEGDDSVLIPRKMKEIIVGSNTRLDRIMSRQQE